MNYLWVALICAISGFAFNVTLWMCRNDPLKWYHYALPTICSFITLGFVYVAVAPFIMKP